MRRLMCLLLFPAMLAGFTARLRAQAALRFDGIYQSEQDVRMGTWTYLRFTPDGMVISFLTNGRPDQLGAFSLANTILPFGSVTVRDGRISFTVSHCDGVLVDHEGHAEGDRLYLHVRSRYGDYQADEVFTFVPIPAERIHQWDSRIGWVEQPCGPPSYRGP